MLKALELVGFKSFADKTRFDFPDGITVVVGPNGSGKSNVVDAVKWVLGSQSAKSLRGADMADVIFKGSAAGGRRPSNSAEVTLILDNSKRTFHNDSDEVQVTRRTFRSGDTEYAINGDPCRLKDIKDLFRGTGVGVDAYSLIEQGKVDRLLQASAKDRRGIFEEAAGISRFKAKKVEAERRMQRVDQNLLRLSDIVDEVGRRLNTLKTQASKAQRYREITHQLMKKRCELGWVEQTLLRRQRLQFEGELVSAQASRDELNEKLRQLEHIAETEKKRLAELQVQQLNLQERYLDAQKEVIATETGYAAAVQRSDDLNAERSITEERLAALKERVSLGTEESLARQDELVALQKERDEAVAALAQRESNLAQTQSSLKRLSEELDTWNKRHAELTKKHGELRSRIVAFELHRGELQRTIDELLQSQTQIQKELADYDSETLDLRNSLNQARETIESVRLRRQEAEATLQASRNEIYQKQEAIATIQGKLHGVHERLQVLEQLEDQFTAAGRGGQQLLRLARANQTDQIQSSTNSLSQSSQAWQSVRGLVADLLSSEMHIAPLIDVALGPLADAIVLNNGLIVDWINEGGLMVEGRVTLLRLDRLPNRRSGEKIQLDGLRGVIGRADRLTQFPAEFEPLMRSLLGTTWFVDSLFTALELSHFRGAGLRFVTAECQLVDSDGSITIGALQAGLGLISRRTEMQTARDDIAVLKSKLGEATKDFLSLQHRLVQEEEILRTAENNERQVAQSLSRFEAQMESCEDRRLQIVKKQDETANQLASCRTRIQELETSCIQSEEEIALIESERSEGETFLSSLKEQNVILQERLQREQEESSNQRVLLARQEQRLEGLRLTLEQLKLDASERERNVAEAMTSVEALVGRIQASTQLASELQARIDVARQHVVQIELERSEQTQKIDTQNATTNSAIRQGDSGRRQLEKNEDRIQSLMNSIGLIDEQAEQLLAHYLSEYQIPLPTIEPLIQSVEPFEGWNDFVNRIVECESSEAIQAVKHSLDAEVVQLRNEVAQTGSVNMEALDELDELQSRFDRLSTHQSDLNRAKDDLFSTMKKIDEDSRHLFMETLDSIRKNFQDLYRRSFGGGFADIILENESDPESGIEIVATPPGKTTLSNSLLSGGEKALTAVALIMAFFQYRPSPFCILDEVDAPFDEANIGRFVTVLREFLDSTKFIVVTHSKKTMTAANMIYGVTMQESGVSRQVSVRFEEVNDRGEVIETEQKRAA